MKCWAIPLTILEIGLQCFDIVYHSYDNFRNGSENLTETLNKQAGAASNICTYRCMYINVNIYIYICKKNMYKYKYKYMSMYKYMYMYIYVYLCIYIYVYFIKYMYIYINI